MVLLLLPPTFYLVHSSETCSSFHQQQLLIITWSNQMKRLSLRIAFGNLSASLRRHSSRHSSLGWCLHVSRLVESSIAGVRSGVWPYADSISGPALSVSNHPLLTTHANHLVPPTHHTTTLAELSCDSTQTDRQTSRQAELVVDRVASIHLRITVLLFARAHCVWLGRRRPTTEIAGDRRPPHLRRVVSCHVTHPQKPLLRPKW